MERPNVTLQPSKRTVTVAAAHIYSAYIAAGCVREAEDADQWVKRSVDEAVAIARRVEQAIQSDEELPDDGRQRLRALPDDAEFPNIAPQH